MNDEEIRTTSEKEMTADLWATGLQSNADQSASLVALGWRKHGDFKILKPTPAARGDGNA